MTEPTETPVYPLPLAVPHSAQAAGLHPDNDQLLFWITKAHVAQWYNDWADPDYDPENPPAHSPWDDLSPDLHQEYCQSIVNRAAVPADFLDLLFGLPQN